MKAFIGIVVLLSLVLLPATDACAQPIDDCGTLVQGVECILFDSDHHGVYIVGNLGSYGVGDRVHVSGILDPFCTSFCMQGDGCIQGAIVTSCAIPTLSEWGFIIFGLLLLLGIGVQLRRRRPVTAT